MTPIALRLQRLALLGTAVLMATACGGGGGGESGSPPPPPQPMTTTASGIVMLPTPAASAPAAAPATVCYDNNLNGACDSGEPSTTTDSQGAYTLNGLPAVQPTGAALVAQIPAGTSAAYTVQVPASKPEIINTLTTLVQTGVAQGMPLAAAEAAVAVAEQLQVSAAGLYSNYRTLPAGAERTWFTTLASFIALDLQAGVPLRVGPVASPVSGYEVTSLVFTDRLNYRLNYAYSTQMVDATTGLVPYYSLTQALTAGAPSPTTSNNVSWALSPSGWKPDYSQAYAQAQTSGNPSVVLSSSGYQTILSAQEVDVSGQTVGDVVTRIRATGGNANTPSTLSLPASVISAALTGTMPAGARVRVVRTATMVTPATYSDSDHVDVLHHSLPTMISGYPSLATGTAGTNNNTLLLARNITIPPNPRICPIEIRNVCLDTDIRVTFAANGASADIYVCDYDLMLGSSVNCRIVGATSLTQGLLEDGVTASLAFGSLPTVAHPYLLGRVLIERQNSIYKAKVGSRATTAPSFTVTSRLNRTAFTALASALQIQAPNPSFTTPSPYMGLWRSTYAGSEGGNCAAVLVDALGTLGGVCTSYNFSMFNLVGTVSGLGLVSPVAASTSMGYTGQFSATSASGTWLDPGTSTTGTWSATKY